MAVATHDGLERRHVAEVQRDRILAAIIDLCAEDGAAGVTVGRVVERAGVSRRTFYELFKDCEDCLLAALEHTGRRMFERLARAHDAPGGAGRERSWRERVRAALIAGLAFLDEEPPAARLLVVESLAAGPVALERRAEALARVIAAVDEGRAESRSVAGPPPMTAQAAVGAVLSVIHARISPPAGQAPLMELTNPLMSMIVLPYLGPAAARAELDREVLAPPRSEPAAGDPFKAIDMRLTYRTMRVLLAIGESPGASNRQVGLAAGAVDEGQISKLLARLKRLGLIDAGGDGHRKGAPNAWSLTPTGREVHRAISGQRGPAPP
jgi:AcrR family transcriptional regulator